MFSLYANSDIYVILDMDLESIYIGGQKKSIGDEFSIDEKIEWPQIANCRVYVVKKNILLKREVQKGDVEEINNIKVQENGNPAYKYFILGHRGEIEVKKVYRLFKEKPLLISVKHLAKKDMKPEVIWKKGQNYLINPISRTEDEKFYEITNDTFYDIPDNNICAVSIRETSLFDSKVVEYVYQDLILVFVP